MMMMMLHDDDADNDDGACSGIGIAILSLKKNTDTRWESMGDKISFNYHQCHTTYTFFKKG